MPRRRQLRSTSTIPDGDRLMPRIDQRGRDEAIPPNLWVRLRPRLVLGIGGNLAAGSTLSALLLFAAERWATDALLVAGAITYSVRHAIHLHLGYRRQRGTHGRRLAGLTRADAVIAACFNVGAATCLCAGLSGWAVAAFAASIFLSVILVSGATIVLTRDLHIQRGSEWVRGTPAFTWLATSLDPHSDLFGKPFLWLMRKTTPVREASCYVVCLLAILLVVATVESATAIKSIPDAMHLPGAREGPAEPVSRRPLCEP
jgi:hypothetical protein